MQVDTAAVDGACEADAPVKSPRRRSRRSQAAKPRLLSLSDLDRRTAVFRVVSDEIAAIAADLGGSDRLSTAEHAIIHDAALAGAMAQDLGARWLRGEEVQAGEFATLINARRRLLESVGIRRQPRPVGELDLAGIVVRLDRDDAGLL